MCVCVCVQWVSRVVRNGKVVSRCLVHARYACGCPKAERLKGRETFIFRNRPGRSSGAEAQWPPNAASAASSSPQSPTSEVPEKLADMTAVNINNNILSDRAGATYVRYIKFPS